MGLLSFLAKLLDRSHDAGAAAAAAGARTLHDDFEDVVRGRAAVLLSPPRVGTPAELAQTRALPRSVDLGDGVGFEMGIVGEASYDVEIRRIAGRPQPQGTSVEFTVSLLPEPTNHYDPNAVVVLSDRSKTIGYLSREHAVEYSPVFTALSAHGQVAQCRAKTFGGTKAKPNIGVWLDIEPVEELLARLTNDQPIQTEQRVAAKRLSVQFGRLDLAGVDALRAGELEADSWTIADGPERAVTITFKSWQHFEPDLPTPKSWDQRFYNEMMPVHVIRVLCRYVKLRTPAKKAGELWRAIDVAYHRREQAPETRAFAELLMERFARHYREADGRPKTYVWHAKLLEERARWDEAAAVLQQAIALGIDDGTSRGFIGRLGTLQKKAKRACAATSPSPP